jgi:hypothetical protein
MIDPDTLSAKCFTIPKNDPQITQITPRPAVVLGLLGQLLDELSIRSRRATSFGPSLGPWDDRSEMLHAAIGGLFAAARQSRATASM